jgi:hypothetical protein
MKSLLFVAAALVPALTMAQPSTPAAQDAGPAPATASTPAAPEPVRAAFTSGVADREPVNRILSLGNNEHTIYYFTDLRGLSGQTVTHRWQYEGTTVAEVQFQVRGPRWRVWSRKALLPDQIGEWTVSVLNQAGDVIASNSFLYTQVEPTTVASGERETRAAGNSMPAATIHPR